jgi:hypothetical protein
MLRHALVIVFSNAFVSRLGVCLSACPMPRTPDAIGLDRPIAASHAHPRQRVVMTAAPRLELLRVVERTHEVIGDQSSAFDFVGSVLDDGHAPPDHCRSSCCRPCVQLFSFVCLGAFVCRQPRPLLELPMEAASKNVYRPTIAIKGGVCKQLVIQGERCRGRQLPTVIGFHDILGLRIKQYSVSDK